MINFHPKLIITCIIESFKDTIAKELEAYPQIKNDNAINSFKQQLQNTMKADGRYIERYVTH